jgi:hypothetical protein
VSAGPGEIHIAYPADVPTWFEAAWSFCEPPSEDEKLRRLMNSSILALEYDWKPFAN